MSYPSLRLLQAFSYGIGSLAVGILDMVLINFTIWDMLACAAIGSSIMYKIIPTSRKLFGSSSLVAYWRWGVGKDGEIGSRAIENEDPFDLRIPMERVREKVRISERLYDILQGKLTLDNYEKFYEVSKGAGEGKGEGMEAWGGEEEDVEDVKSVDGDGVNDRKQKEEEGEERKEGDEEVVVKVVAKNAGRKTITTSNYYPESTKKGVKDLRNPMESPLREKWRRRTTVKGGAIVGLDDKDRRADPQNILA